MLVPLFAAMHKSPPALHRSGGGVCCFHVWRLRFPGGNLLPLVVYNGLGNRVRGVESRRANATHDLATLRRRDLKKVMRNPCREARGLRAQFCNLRYCKRTAQPFTLHSKGGGSKESSHTVVTVH